MPQKDCRIRGSERGRKGRLRELSSYSGVCCLRLGELRN